MTTKELLDNYGKATEDSIVERALWNLLKANEKHIVDIFEYDLTGHSLHKSFRQTDVTGNSHTDMAIWLLLNKAPIFWSLLEKYN